MHDPSFGRVITRDSAQKNLCEWPNDGEVLKATQLLEQDLEPS